MPRLSSNVPLKAVFKTNVIEARIQIELLRARDAIKLMSVGFNLCNSNLFSLVGTERTKRPSEETTVKKAIKSLATNTWQ